MQPPAGHALALTNASNDRLTLQHPVFRTFVDPYFRLSVPDQMPVFVVQMDDREATLPITAMMAEFGISLEDADGRMLAQVIKALDFVAGLEIGDPLPAEILSGAASWPIHAIHRDLAAARIERTAAGSPAGADDASRSASDHRDALIDELAYIEALREWLLGGAMRVERILGRIIRACSGASSHKDVLTQNRRLALKGIAEIEAQLAVVDHHVADLRPALDDFDRTRQILRRQRDRLHCRWRAWEPFCRNWNATGVWLNSQTWSLSQETYRFLAPRYMTVVEWRNSSRSIGQSSGGMTW